MKIVSYLVGAFIALVILAPPFNISETGAVNNIFDVPMLVNSQAWVFAVAAAAMFGLLLLSYKLHWSLKALIVYLFFDSFMSQVPYYSFNAYVVVVLSVYFFLIVKKCDLLVLLKFIEAAFWVQVLFITAQHFGMDKLINMDRPEPVFFGTAAQQMRMGSILAIMSPFLIYRSKWYIIPIIILSVMSQTLGFSLALAAGIFLYLWYTVENIEAALIISVLVFGIWCITRSWMHVHVEIVEGRLPIWWVIVKSWALDTHTFESYMAEHHHFRDFFGASQTGPWCWRTFLFGHGPDSFIALFRVYKHDPYSGFVPGHNDWLQIPWETGLFGAILFGAFCAHLAKLLWKYRLYLLISGAVVISINMFFAFPMRMTQTMVLLIAFAAVVENTAEFLKRRKNLLAGVPT